MQSLSNDEMLASSLDDEWETLDVKNQETKHIVENDVASLELNNGPVRILQNVRSSPKQEAPPVRQQQQQQQLARRPVRKNGNTIVDHPMQRISSHFIQHLAREIWDLDWNIRFALVCLACGALFYIINSCFWYALYPKQLLFLVTVAAGAGIPLFFYYKPTMEAAIKVLQETSSSPERVIADFLSNFDSTQLRFITALLLFGIPAALELRTLQFLTNLVGSSLFSAFIFLLALVGAAVYWKNDQDWDLLLLIPRRCTQTGLYMLYGSALWVALGTDWRHIPSLASRFLLATAVLLWKTSAADTSQAVHKALRLTVKDALQEVGTTVQQDELLQLAMLRWIVDYWSTSSSSPSNSSTTPPTMQRSQSSTNTNGATRAPSARQTTQHPHRDMEWTELWGMLQATTNQMTSEVDTLQQHEPSHVPAQQSTFADFYSSGERPTSSRALPQDSSSRTFSASGNRNNGYSASAQVPQFNDSAESLQAMLSSMDIDERAKPAVLAYKRAVEGFPPSNRAAFSLGLLRRCPAIALLASYVISGLAGLYQSGITMMVILLPFALFEGLRIGLWIAACQRASNSTATEGRSYWLLESVDSMTILLMDESYVVSARLPTLLVVWFNVESSVSALEISLTTARCVQTTVAAVDFAANILNIASFGYQVSQHGWMHGLTIVGTELLHLHTTGTDLSKLSHGVATPPGASYTSSAVSALRNSQTMSRNFRVLADEESSHSIVGPVLGALSLLIGQGWLWGKAHEAIESSPQPQPSTVEITELDDESDAQEDQAAVVDDSESVHSNRSQPGCEDLCSNNDKDVTVDICCGSAQEDMMSPDSDADEGTPASAILDESVSPYVDMCSHGPEQGRRTAESGSADVTAANVRSDFRAVTHESVHSTEVFETEASIMMNLLAQSDEYSLLTQEEKASIMEKLAEKSQSANEECVEWVRGVKLTLRGLLDEHALTHTDPMSASYRPSTVLESEEKLQLLQLPVVDFSRSGRISGCDDDNCSFEPLQEQHFESLDLGGDNCGALSVSSDEASAGVRNAPRQITHAADNDETNFEPLDGAQSLGTAVALMGTDECDEDANEEDNIWLKVGGGLAVVGAVVGSVVLVAAQNGGGEDKKRRNQTGGSRPAS